MRPSVKTYLVDDAGKRVFGPGPAELLRRVRELGSLRAASISMGMAYTKALGIIRSAEHALGAPLTTRSVGGLGGGGSTPTYEADALLAAYERWTAAVETASSAQFTSAFAGQVPGEAAPTRRDDEKVRLVGVAILAAGHARRFGANKLVAPLLGEPVLLHTLRCVPPGLPIVAASASPEVDAVLDELGIERVCPEGPGQGDSVRALARFARTRGWNACLFLPGDQPLVGQDSIHSLLALGARRPNACVRLSWRGRAASPTLLPASLFDRLVDLSGDVGGSAALGDDVVRASVEATWPWELWDVDTPRDLGRVREILEAGLGRRGSL